MAAKLIIDAARDAHHRGYSHLALEIIEQAAEFLPADALAQKEQVELLTRQGIILAWLGERERSLELLERALTIARGLGSEQILVSCLRALGLRAQLFWEVDAASRYFEEGLLQAEKMGDQEIIYDLLTDRASLALELGDRPKARELLQLGHRPRKSASPEQAFTLPGILGSLALEQGDYEEAEKQFKGLLKRARRRENPANQIRAMHSLGNLRLREGRARAAVRWLRKAEHVIRATGVDVDVAGVLTSLAAAEAELGDVAQAARLADAARVRANEFGDRRAKAYALALLGRLESSQGKGDAIAHLREAYEILQELDDHDAALSTLRELIDAHRLRGDSAQEHDVIKELLQSLPSFSHAERADLLREAALAYLGQSPGAEQAASLFRRSLAEMAFEVGEQNLAADAYYFGEILAAVGAFKEALSFYDQALSLRNETPESSLVFHILNSRAVVLAREGQIDAARSDFRRCEELAIKADDRAMKSITYSNMAILERQVGNLEEGFRLIGLALDYARQLGNPELEVRSLLHLARFYGETSDLAEARETYENARSIAAKLGLEELETASLRGLADCAFTEGRLSEAAQLSVHVAKSALSSRAFPLLQLDLIRLSASLAQQHKLSALSTEIRKLVDFARRLGVALPAISVLGNAAHQVLTGGGIAEAARLYAGSLYLLSSEASTRGDNSEELLRGAIEAVAQDVHSARPEDQDRFLQELRVELDKELDGNLVGSLLNGMTRVRASE